MSGLTLKISDEIKKIDLRSGLLYLDWHRSSKYFSMEAGAEHYKLLAGLASQLPVGSTVIDLGTFTGASALALASNHYIKVITYDICDYIPTKIPCINQIDNIERKIKDGAEDAELFLEAPLILLDINPHAGVPELNFIHKMMALNYRGIIICDDIYLNTQMKIFWNSISLKKIDVTKYGHVTGTGIIVFDQNWIDVSLL